MAARTVAKNDVASVIVRDSRYEPSTTHILRNKELDDRARVALAFIERWGMVAAVPDGEDSAGRAKLRLATHDEVIRRGFECAALAWAMAEKLGWMITIPDVEEIERTDNGGPTETDR